MSWTLTYEGYDPKAEGLRETLCTLGNGRFATRGALLEADADGLHYPGTYLAGGYNRSVSAVGDREVENEDLVNWPNWLPVRVKAGDGWLLPTNESVVEHRQSLDIRTGTLYRRTRLRDGDGRGFLLEETRIVSMADPFLAAIRLTVTPDEDGPVTIRSFVDGGVVNCGVPRYRALESRHLEVRDIDHDGADVVLVSVSTRQSRLEATVAARTRITSPEGTQSAPWREGDRAGTEISFAAEAVRPFTVEKVVAFVTERDHAVASTDLTAKERVFHAGTFAELHDAHVKAWATLWDDFDIVIMDGASQAQLLTRLHLYHLIVTLSPHTCEMDAGAPARGWHGEAYRGHIFWDELYIFRVLQLRAPTLVRHLLMYRFRRLDAARRLAREEGLPGAMFPWQSGSDGREETQTLHLNPNSGRWLPDVTHRQRHVGLAIAYNVLTYFSATDDLAFMIEAGAEMLVEISRFFAGLTVFDERTGRYHIRGVMGPDEFHTAMPGTDPEEKGGIDDNAYTNVLTAWVMTGTIDALENLPLDRRNRLVSRLGVSDEEIHTWQDISERLYVPFLSNGLIAQFEGYESLRELDFEAYRQKYGDIHRMDRILEAEGKDPNDYKVSKQADVLMLPFLFSADALQEIFEQLGYAFDRAEIPRLVEYYDARTSHGSTLSTIVQAWVVARTNRAQSWELFCRALKADVEDVQGGTTREGIHLGAMCGTIDMVQNMYLGCEVRGDALHVNPVLPDDLGRIATRVRYLGQDVAIEATHETVRISTDPGSGDTIYVAYRGRQRRLPPGRETVFRLLRPRERPAAQ